MSKKEALEKEKKEIWNKPLVKDNKVFDTNQIEDFWTLFNLYADARRQADMRQIVATAKTLGYDKSHEFIYKGIVSICDQCDGEWIGFEPFLGMLTDKIGHPNDEQGRRCSFSLLDPQGEERVTFNTLKKMSEMLKLNLTEDQIEEAIQNIAGKGKQAISWEQFNSHIAKRTQKK